MSEPFSKSRPLPGDVDLRATRGAPAPGASADPLAELARLVGREDPFRDLFPRRPETPALTGPATPARETRARFPVPGDLHGFDDAPKPVEPAHDLPGDEHLDFGHDPAFAADSHDFGSGEQGRRSRDALHFPPIAPVEPPFDEPEGGYYDGSVPLTGQAPALNADLWAQGMPEPVSAEPMDFVAQTDDDRPATHGANRRTLIVLAAVLALTAGGLGATFLVRGGAHATVASGETPTIMADTAPTKIQPPDTSNAATGGDGTTALLEKSASDNVGNAKVVNTQERPIDLAQLPKAAPAAAVDDGRIGTSANASPFPEPKKVKTILIRPDGSVVGNDAAPPALDMKTVAAAEVGVAMPTAATGQAAVPPAASVAKPATPKSTARVSTTPKSTATPVDGAAPVKPKPPHAAKPKPVETADAAPTPPETTASTTPATSGGFAVQLAAPATEQDAKDAMARLEKKFASELGASKPSIRKADKGDKTVYRVRVSNLAQDDAKALCARLQAGGGSCFVVRN